MNKTTTNRYQSLISTIFEQKYRKGDEVVAFTREELLDTVTHLGMQAPKNPGDVIYSVRYRTPLPTSVLKTQPKGKEWIIEGAGRSRYEFRLVPVNRIEPNPSLLPIKIPDATPEIVSANSLSDEQALLAKLRYNRLIDIFLGITTYSLQNHLRTTVKGIGQIEIDEIYIGLDKNGSQYVIPVQAKSGTDQLSTVQTKQDMSCCSEKYPHLACRPISTQFLDANRIAIFELCLDDQNLVRIRNERHYRLVPSSQISKEEIERYKQTS